MHRRTTLTCHSEERSDVGISQYPVGPWESLRRNRNCLPEIAPQGHFLALRAQGATSAYGLLAMTNLGAGAVGEAAGNLQARKALTARKGHAASVRRQSRQRLRKEPATDAIGFYSFIDPCTSF